MITHARCTKICKYEQKVLDLLFQICLIDVIGIILLFFKLVIVELL